MAGREPKQRRMSQWTFFPMLAGRMPSAQRAQTPAACSPGDAFGEYVIDDQLGEGGMGIVFRAIREDGAVVALKVIKPGLVAD